MRPDDWTFCTYRGHAHTLARGASMEGVLGELMGRRCGLLGGKGGSMHLTDVTKGAMGSYAIIGAHLPVAAGAAWSAQYRGTEQVAVCFFGDGTANIGAFHEALNFSAVWKLPVDVRVREQPLHGIHADQCGDRSRASGRRPRIRLWLAVHRCRWQRCGRGLQGCNRGVDQGARRRRAIADRSHDLPPQRAFARRSGQSTARKANSRNGWLRDPVVTYRERLLSLGFNEPTLKDMEAEAMGKVDRATEISKASPVPSVDDIEKNVWADGGSAWRN